MQDINNHQRVNDILLGPIERPALRWLSAHLPAWVTPDACTAIGVFGALITLVSYVLSGTDRDFLWLASFGFVVNWFGDSLDGNLARFRRIERPAYGFYVDHTTDALSQTMIFLGLGLTPYVSFAAACLALIAYLMLSVLAYVQTCVTGEFKISYGRLGPTEIRALAILLNTTMYAFGLRTFGSILGLELGLEISAYDVFVGAIALLLFGFFLSTFWRHVRLLSVSRS